VTDVLTHAQRRLNMSRIKGQDTKPELTLRRGLHRRGLRYRLHRAELPGRPDLVFPARRTVVFVHGCFWHGHDCVLCKQPSTRTAFWTEKIWKNKTRDRDVIARLLADGWRVLVVWECAMKGQHKMDSDRLFDTCAAYIRRSGPRVREIFGAPPAR
jgi:DNA mismatch endonuclease, patch repair protein